jgi:hypothetical protein
MLVAGRPSRCPVIKDDIATEFTEKYKCSVSEKGLQYRHSGLDPVSSTGQAPESSVLSLDSRFRGSDSGLGFFRSMLEEQLTGKGFKILCTTNVQFL